MAEGGTQRVVGAGEIGRDEVRIGELGNLVTLKREEWNVLVDLIQSGTLKKI